MTRLSRRGLLGALALMPLAGCGFQPVYRRTESGNPGPAARELAAINVVLIPDRPGQLLRQALQQRFYGASGEATPAYDLGVFYWIAGEGIAILPDNTNTRTRLIARANWTLNARDPGHTHIADGSAHAMESINVFDAQYFAGDLETEQASVRLADQVADQITLRLATFFRARAGMRTG
jgi:LPS-assembly lipoprotein